MKRIISILLTGLMVVGMFGCSKKPEPITDIPASPEEAMTDANLVFYYYEAVTGTVGGDCSVAYRLYRYNGTELVLSRTDHTTDDEEISTYRLVPASTLDDCMKVVKKYKMGKGKWINGIGITGGYCSAGFYKKDEWIKVTSDNMPDNGQEAFSAIHKILANA